LRKTPKIGTFRKIVLLLEHENLHIRLKDWTDNLTSKGRWAFSLKQAKESFPTQSDIAIKRSLNRLSVKGEIISVYKGYYLIIPPQYMSRGILPPSLFLDGLMQSLERPYYVGLLNAASFYGAAHQQPQEFFVFTNFPVLRPTNKKGLKINYISKKEITEKWLENRKTESGYLKISSPELTAADLVQFEKRIGGLNRAATVLNELADEMKTENINDAFLQEIPVTTIQRLGYLLEKILEKETLSNHLYDLSKKNGLPFFRIPLKASGKVNGFSSDERWKVIINTEIEIDE
jgi:predicted transcriptional regulator of viral defense system